MRLPWIVLVAALAACASASDDHPSPVPVRELTAGAGRIRGGGIRMDVQIGRPVSNTTVKGGKIVAKPAGAVTQ